MYVSTVVRGCAVSRRYIHVCHSYGFILVNKSKLSVHTVVKLCTLGVFALGMSLVS